MTYEQMIREITALILSGSLPDKLRKDLGLLDQAIDFYLEQKQACEE